MNIIPALLQALADQQASVSAKVRGTWRRWINWASGIPWHLVALWFVVPAALLYFVIWPGPDYGWTGFGSERTDDYYRPAKTLWDWLDLALIPAVLAFGAWWLRRAATKTEHEIAEERWEQEVLDNYLKEVSELLLKHQLGPPDPNNRAVAVAYSLTLTVLRRLRKVERKNSVIRFLRSAELLGEYGILAARDLRGANLSGIELPRANLRNSVLNGVAMHQADLNAADLREAEMRSADLRGANLRGADLRKAELQKADLRGANLRGADLSEAALHYADLREADLFSAKLRGARLERANLRGAGLAVAKLSGADLDRANLKSADLRKADLREADLNKADLRWAVVSGTDFRGALLKSEQLTRARRWKHAYRDSYLACGKPIPDPTRRLAG